MGLGSDNVFLIKTDDIGKIDPSHLGNLFDTQKAFWFISIKFFCGSQKVKFCAQKLKVLCRSWSRPLQVKNEFNVDEFMTT